MSEKIFYLYRPCVWWPAPGTENPDVSFVAPLVRRRMSVVERVALYLAHVSAPETQNFRAVFASQFGEWNQTIKLMRQMHTDNEISPAGFSASVHNAAAAYFSLLFKNKESYTSIAAGNRTLEMGLIETFTTSGDVLFVYSDEATPEFLSGHVPDICAHGASFFISGRPNDFCVVVSFYNIGDIVAPSFSDVCAFLGGMRDEIRFQNIQIKRRYE